MGTYFTITVEEISTKVNYYLLKKRKLITWNFCFETIKNWTIEKYYGFLEDILLQILKHTYPKVPQEEERLALFISVETR